MKEKNNQISFMDIANSTAIVHGEDWYENDDRAVRLSSAEESEPVEMLYFNNKLYATA